MTRLTRGRLARMSTALAAALSLLGSTLVLATWSAGPAEAADSYRGAVVGDRGTLLGSAAYDPPAGAIYVSPSGSDGSAGSAANPVRTVQRGLALAPSGGTVVLRAGVYHESLTVQKKVTIQNFPREVAWLDGSSTITNWTRSGSTWSAPWGTFFSPSNYAGGIRSDHPYANYPGQMFLDGQPLRQVGSLGEVVSGAFYADAASKRMVIGSDPTSKVATASDLTSALHIGVKDVTLRGFGVRRYATTAQARAAILMDPAGGVFENLVVVDNSSIGLALSGANKTVRNVVVERNGMMGMGMHEANNSVVSRSILRYNNYERFATLPVSAGVKITKSSNVKIDNNLVTDNYFASGVWFDMYSSVVKVVNNTLRDNGELQVNVEATKQGIVANNYISGGRKGIDLRDVEGVVVANNRLGAYTLMGVFVAQDNRWTKRPADAPSDFSMLTRNISIINNVFFCGTRFQLFANDENGTIPASKFNLSVSGNVFSSQRKSPELNLMGWGLGAGKYDFIQTPSDLMKKNAAWKNLQASDCDETPDSSFSKEALASQSVALPADVASATGFAGGVRVVGLLGGAPEGSEDGESTPVESPPSVPATVEDTFTRTVSSGSWGKSDSGHTWSLAGGSSAFSVANGRGTINLLPAQNREALAGVAATSSTSTTILISPDVLPSKGAVGITVIGRKVGGSYYGARLWISSEGVVRLYALRDESPLAASVLVSSKHVAGATYYVKLDVRNTSPTIVRTKAWRAGGVEPSSWMISASDSNSSLQKPGAAGIKAYLSASGAGTARIGIDTYRLAP